MGGEDDAHRYRHILTPIQLSILNVTQIPANTRLSERRPVSNICRPNHLFFWKTFNPEMKIIPVTRFRAAQAFAEREADV
jgi:hypothetical protein